MMKKIGHLCLSLLILQTAAVVFLHEDQEVLVSVWMWCVYTLYVNTHQLSHIQSFIYIFSENINSPRT